MRLDRVRLLDGGLSTALAEGGHDLGGELWTARLVADDPAAVTRAHRAFLEAGAEIVITASYQASVEGFVRSGHTRTGAEELLASTTRLARDAVEQVDRDGVLVAASVGPFGATVADGSEYTGALSLTDRELVAFHTSRVAILASTNPDLLACETIPSVREVDALVAALATVPSTPAWLSLQCASGSRLGSGEPLEDAVRVALTAPSLVALGVNCTAPAHVAEALTRIRALTSLPLVAYPNLGATWDASSRSWRGDVADPFTELERWLALGVTVVGGCCGVGPGAIGGLASRIDADAPL